MNEEMIQEQKEFDITELPGVGTSTAIKLVEAGYGNLLAIAVASPKELSEASGMTEAGSRKVINAARKAAHLDFESGDQLLARRATVIKLTTGSKAFDAMMDGGFESRSITECYGAFGSGKTALAHQLAINVQLPREKGGAEGVVVWIDSEGTFRPERIKQIAEAAGLDPTEALKNIKVARAYNSDHQMLLVDKVEELILQEKLSVKLVIVDGLMSHFRSEFYGRGQLADRQQKLNRHMHDLIKLADLHNLIVYVTNQVSSDPAAFFGDPTKPIGGNIVGHASAFRIYLRKGKKGSRVAKLVDAPNLPDQESAFMIAEAGITDIE